MARELNDIFDECYEHIRAGESLDSCLARYPEHEAELRALLKTAFDVGRRVSYIQPRPEFKHWTQVRLERPQHRAKQQRQVERPSLFGWQRSWAVALAVILIVVLAGGGTAAASAVAQPDQTLYPVKLATEQVRVAFAISNEQRAEVHAQLAQTRAVEVETMANEGKAEQAAITAERFANQLEQADYAMARVQGAEAGGIKSLAVPQPPAPPEAGPTTASSAAGTQEQAVVSERTQKLQQSLNESTERSLTALQNALGKAPPQAKPALEQAINRISEKSHGKSSQQNTGAGNNGDKGKNHNSDNGEKKGHGDADDSTQIQPQSQQNQNAVNKGNSNKTQSTQTTINSGQSSTVDEDDADSGPGANSAAKNHGQKDNHL